MTFIQPHLRLPLEYCRTHLGLLFKAIAWRVVHVVVPMQVTVLAGLVVDTASGQPPHVYGWSLAGTAQDEILRASGAALMVVAALTGLSAYKRRISTAILSRGFVTDLRRRASDKLTDLSLDVHHEIGQADLMARVLGDTGRMRTFMSRVFIQLITNLVRAGYPIVMLFVLDAHLAWIVLCILPPQWVLLRYLQRRLHTATHASRDARTEFTGAVKEVVDGIETIHGLDARPTAAKGLRDQGERLEERQLRVNRLSALSAGLVWFLTSIGLGFAWWLGGHDVLSGRMTAGDLVQFAGFAAFAYSPFRRLSDILATYRKGLVSLERLDELLGRDTTVVERPDAPDVRVTRGEYVLHGVTFGVHGESILRDADAVVRARALTAIVGTSGSGKTTLLRLLGRLVDPTEGVVQLDGQDLRDVSLGSLRRVVALVPQHPTVFSASVHDNLVIGNPDARVADVRVACARAGCLAFVESLPRGFGTMIGGEGVRLSGGEAQRLAIARALLMRPSVLLLDEPTAALDTDNEQSLVSTLLELSSEVTVAMVAHRPSTHERAHHVIRVEEGEVVESPQLDSSSG